MVFWYVSCGNDNYFDRYPLACDVISNITGTIYSPLCTNKVIFL